MPTGEIFRVNYFVGAMLAQGGNLWLDGSKIVFSPTSAIDRAMGAKDVEILFNQIRSVNYTGSLSRTFHIKTDDRVHRFEGGQAKRFWELLEMALPNKGLMTQNAAQVKNSISQPKPTASLACDHCSKSIQPGYSFCPYCGVRLKSVCTSCHKSVDLNWAVCAYCGWKFGPTPS